MTARAAPRPAASGWRRTAGAIPPESRRPRHAIESWPELERALGAAGSQALFLDFDGTLAPIRRQPESARCPARVRRILATLAERQDLWIGIVSGRRSRKLRELVRVRGIEYLGAYGAERGNAPVRISAGARRALAKVRGALALEMGRLAGISMEYKGLSLVVHYRRARRPTAALAEAILRRTIAPAAKLLRVISGQKSWEVVPREIPGKGAAVAAVMRSLPAGCAGIYIGDDAADEEAFAALPAGITIRVGREARSRARYFLRSPAEVFRWLTRFEEALP